MIALLRLITTALEILVSAPLRVVNFLTDWIAFNPRLGPLRHIATAVIFYVIFAVVLVYIFAPIRGMIGQTYLSEKLRYDAERWLATAIYDQTGSFAGTFDPRLDSRRDVNFTDRAIEVGSYRAFPDHKSIPVREVPEHYWQCLLFHEDRHLGTALNPYGIDLFGVLKIPYSTIKRSIRLKRIAFGVGGSTLPMQFARVIYKTPPHTRENAFTKIKRKASEWWMAPVIYHELTRGGSNHALKQWAANHLWLAQRTGGSPLHGIEVTSRIVFGKEAKALTTAEQFVLASAVNRPIILLEGSERLNEVRLDRWRYIAEVRAKACADNIIADDETKKQILFELVNLAGGPPDPQVKPKLQKALDAYAPTLARRAEANPIIRANALMPAARFGIREEMKQDWGYDWRSYVRGLTTTFDAADNLAFSRKVETVLEKLDKRFRSKIGSEYTLSATTIARDSSRRRPQIIIAAADANGRIVRYFESDQTASYFGSMNARNRETGFYERGREGRMIASIGKVIAAAAIANEGRDLPGTLYLDTKAPSRGLETCTRTGTQRRGRKAIVAFACSLNDPLLNRAAKLGQARIRSLIDTLGFNMPPKNERGEGTPPSTAAVLGLISGSPRRVHQMSSVVLASLIGRHQKPVTAPSLVKSYDYTSPSYAESAPQFSNAIVPSKVVRPRARGMVRRLLQAPLCHHVRGTPHGTLSSLSKWCAARRGDVKLHFAKTGTQVTEDPDATVDAWITGGIQFSTGAAYSYVVVVGTGSPHMPWARRLHSSQVAAPLLESLLKDLKADASLHPRRDLLPKPKLRPVAQAETDANANQTGSHRSPTPSDLQLRALKPNF